MAAAPQPRYIVLYISLGGRPNTDVLVRRTVTPEVEMRDRDRRAEGVGALWTRYLWPTDLTLVNFNGSKKFFCEDVLSHALYHPTKFQLDWSSHLGVYKQHTT